jgi:hypothetical protein
MVTPPFGFPVRLFTGFFSFLHISHGIVACGHIPLVFLLLQFGSFGISAFENWKFQSNSALSSWVLAMLLGSLGSDNSIDPENVRDELRTELVLLDGALKQLNPDLDFSDALCPWYRTCASPHSATSEAESAQGKD